MTNTIEVCSPNGSCTTPVKIDLMNYPEYKDGKRTSETAARCLTMQCGSNGVSAYLTVEQLRQLVEGLI